MKLSGLAKGTFQKNLVIKSCAGSVGFINFKIAMPLCLFVRFVIFN